MICLKSQINGVNIPYEKSTDELISMLDNEMPLFIAACEALSCKTDVSSFTTLMSLLKNDDCYIRRIGIESLGNHIMFENAIDDILMCLDDKSHYVVNAAIRTMATHCIKKSHDKIINLLNSKDESIRETAFSALEHLFEESDFELALSLFNDKNERIRKLIPGIVLKTANEKNWHKAYNMFKRSGNEKTRFAACRLLNKFGSDVNKKDFENFLQDKDGHIRKYAVKVYSDNTAK